jgi:hypothetical protein
MDNLAEHQKSHALHVKDMKQDFMSSIFVTPAMLLCPLANKDGPIKN